MLYIYIYIIYKTNKTIKMFTCYKCTKMFKIKQSLKRHLDRKYPCKAIISNNSNSEVIQSYPKLSKVIQKLSKVIQEKSKVILKRQHKQ